MSGGGGRHSRHLRYGYLRTNAPTNVHMDTSTVCTTTNGRTNARTNGRSSTNGPTIYEGGVGVLRYSWGSL